MFKNKNKQAVADLKRTSANLLKNSFRFSLMILTVLVFIASNAISAPLGKAKVTIENTSTKKSFSCVTDASGKFEFKNLPEGNYTMSCVSSGEVLSWSWGASQSGTYAFEVKAPRDVATGQSSGKRMHKPITIIKELDKSTPMLGKKTTASTSPNDKGKAMSSSSSSSRCVVSVSIDDTNVSGTLSEK